MAPPRTVNFTGRCCAKIDGVGASEAAPAAANKLKNRRRSVVMASFRAGDSPAHHIETCRRSETYLCTDLDNPRRDHLRWSKRAALRRAGRRPVRGAKYGDRARVGRIVDVEHPLDTCLRKPELF